MVLEDVEADVAKESEILLLDQSVDGVPCAVYVAVIDSREKVNARRFEGIRLGYGVSGGQACRVVLLTAPNSISKKKMPLA